MRKISFVLNTCVTWRTNCASVAHGGFCVLRAVFVRWKSIVSFRCGALRIRRACKYRIPRAGKYDTLGGTSSSARTDEAQQRVEGTPRAWQRAQCRCVPTRLEGAMLAAECFPRCTDPSIWPATAQAEQNCVPDLIRASSLAVLDTFEETRLQREQPQHRLLQLALSLQQL